MVLHLGIKVKKVPKLQEKIDKNDPTKIQYTITIPKDTVQGMKWKKGTKLMITITHDASGIVLKEIK